MTQKKMHNSNHNVINIKIVHPKEKKNKRKRRRGHKAKRAIGPYVEGPSYSTIQSQLPVPLTNKPYYIETNSLNPQLQNTVLPQLQYDAPKPTTQQAFHPQPPPPALSDHSSSIWSDSLSQLSNHDKVHDFEEQHEPHSTHSHAFNDQSHELYTPKPLTRGMTLRDLAKKAKKEDDQYNAMHILHNQVTKENVHKNFSGLKDKIIASGTIKKRENFEHEQQLYARRNQYREKKGSL